MQRLHLHITVDDLARSVRFYTTLFATPPMVEKPDYAKWLLDDPRVNLAISQRGVGAGVEHLGIQVESAEELEAVYGRLRRAEAPVLEEGAVTCCYARSEKSWVADPQGVPWEVFLTSGDSPVYGDTLDLDPLRRAGREACCTPEASLEAVEAVCCTPETAQAVAGAPKLERPHETPCCGAASRTG